ncbi:hypothetical protein HIM_12612 [Hirsutella minnesotensis 3608]|uniref:Uncharacterized protein n=1 Tax=Hirsutella minnesotensis 3608 TaxID=1043627 RepID=A0A0F7ZHU1_9HYPO|nr:hypothetical protein HIM_12612 [Hirsutella minnesotensis 3608]
MDRCESTVRRTSRNILCWLRSYRPHSSYSKPFKLVREQSSTRKYRLLFKRLLAFVLRAHRLKPDTRHKLAGIRLRGRLVYWLDEIWNESGWEVANSDNGKPDESTVRSPEGNDRTATNATEPFEDTGSETGDETEDEEKAEDDGAGGYDEDTDVGGHGYGISADEGADDRSLGVNSKRTSHERNTQEREDHEVNGDVAVSGGRIVERLLQLVFGLSIALCTESPIDGQPDSLALVYFSGILGFSRSLDGFLPARSFTPYLSGLIYIQRLLFLEFALPFQEYPLLGVRRRPRVEQSEQLELVRKRYMVIGSQSAFEEFIRTPARRILGWLESLRIPRRYEDWGGCSVCGHGWLPCQEVVLGHRGQTPAGGAGPDGYCQNKPVVRRMVAALCAHDGQVYGKVLTKVTLELDGVHLSSEEQARRWFQGRIRLPGGGGSGDYWVSNVVIVLDQLLLAFNWERREQQAPERAIDWLEPARWGDELEVEDWARSLDWLVGKCTFCAGRGYGVAHIGHTLRRCRRGGAGQVRRGIGEMLYEEGFLPPNGCPYCQLPRDLCSRWEKSEGGSWGQMAGGRCKYDESLLCDSFVGFYGSGVERYWMDVCESVEENLVGKGEEMMGCDDEAVAAWLVQPLAVAGVEGSEMLRQVSIWGSQGLDAFVEDKEETDQVMES